LITTLVVSFWSSVRAAG